MTNFQIIFWTIGIITTVLFLVSFTMGLLDAKPVERQIKFVSFKTITGFLAIFGWTGIYCIDKDMSNIGAVFTGIIIGIIGGILIAHLLKKINSITIENEK